MNEQQWLDCKNPRMMVHQVRFRPGGVSDRKLRLLGCNCYRSIWKYLNAEQQKAVEVAERFADGEATQMELREVHWEVRVGKHAGKNPVDLDLGLRPLTHYEPGHRDFYSGWEELIFHQLGQKDMYPPWAVPSDWFSAHVEHLIRTRIAEHGPEGWDGEDEEYLYDYWEGTDMEFDAFSAKVSQYRDRCQKTAKARIKSKLRGIILDMFGNPYQPIFPQESWRTQVVRDVAQNIYDNRKLELMPLLADALEDAGCSEQRILDHCRARWIAPVMHYYQPPPFDEIPSDAEGQGLLFPDMMEEETDEDAACHVRGCWVLDLILGKE